MSMKHERPAALFSFVQGMAVCAMAGIAAAMVLCAVDLLGGVSVIPNVLLMEELGLMDAPVALVIIPVLAGAGVGGCLLWLLAEFVMMCSRVKRQTAFTEANVRALGRIAQAFAIGGALLLLCGGAMMDWLLMGLRGVDSPVWGLLPAFAAWSAALLVRAIQVLMKRAVEMQSEKDLTV